MDYSLIVNVVFGTLGIVWGVWKFFSARKEERYERDKSEMRSYADSKAATGKIWVDKLEATQAREIKHNTQKFEAIDGDVDQLQKNLRKLEYQQVAKETVKEMLDERVRPLEASVEKLEGAVERGFKEVSESLVLNDLNTNNVLLTLSRLEGRLEGAGIVKRGE